MHDRRTLTIVGHVMLFIPPLVNGDNNWDEGFDCEVKAQSEIYHGNVIRVRLFMYGSEREDDWTRVEGWSDWQEIYHAPHGWEISEAVPLGTSEQKYSFGENENLKTFEYSGEGALINKFEIYGFRGDDPEVAGWFTRVVAYFNPIKVEMEKTRVVQPA